MIPDARALSEAALQKIAREFNFSETTFVYPGEDTTRPGVRIFTPTQEVPFAGHPLIGTAVALHDAGAPSELTLRVTAGDIAAHVRNGHASFRRETTLETLHHPEPDLVARCLMLPPGSVGPCITVSVGLPFTMSPLPDRTTLSRCDTDIAAFREAHARYPTSFDFAVYAYVRDGDTTHARMFAPLDNIPEDPATGSAAAALAMHLADGAPLDLTILQGEDMGRPSRIDATADTAGVTIAGHAVRVMAGRLLL